jgi:hypothetical protein
MINNADVEYEILKKGITPGIRMVSQVCHQLAVLVAGFRNFIAF